MIYDDIKNLENYSAVPTKVVEFIKTLNPDIENGRHKIDENSFASVNTYDTKPVENCGLEAHKDYIDIQILLSGNEQLDYVSVDDLEIKTDYDEDKDLMFFQVPNQPLNSLHLFPSKFALLYPHEAHRPQMIYNDKSEFVKKIVVKINAGK